LPFDCYDHNDSGYNRHGSSVQLEYGHNSVSHAYYLLFSGHYLLFMDQNHFDHCSTCSGFGFKLQNNVGSIHFNG